jgi:hypothetical protein
VQDLPDLFSISLRRFPWTSHFFRQEGISERKKAKELPQFSHSPE